MKSTYLNQRIPTKKKDKKWREAMMDYYCDMADGWKHEWVRMKENYAMKNNQLDREEYSRICKGLGTEEEAEMFINAYNKSHNIIESLKGEEWNRPFSFGVLNNSERITNRIERDKRRRINELTDKIFEIELQKHQALLKNEIDVSKKGLDQKKAQQLEEQIVMRFEKLYKNLKSPKEIHDKFKNITVAEEIAVHNLMRMMFLKQKLKHIKNDTFEDALIAGVEAVELEISNDYSLPKVVEVNPLELWWEKSPNEKWVQNGQAAGKKIQKTLGAIIEEMGEMLTEQDYDRLMGAYGRDGEVLGMDAKWSYNRDAPSHWKQRENNPMLPVTGNHRRSNMVNVNGKENGWIRDSINYYSGLSMTEDDDTELIDVYTVYWKSQRRLGKYEYINEYGELDMTFVAEDFQIPKEARKQKVKMSSYGNTKLVHYWEDDDGNTVSLQWIWVPEVWKGIRVGTDIYIDIAPMQHGYQSLLNPYDVKLPIYGYIYNNRNAFSVSMMDRIKPWQKLYYVIMSKLLKLITQDRGVLTFLNTLLIDQKLGLDKTLQIAEDNGIIPYNPLSHAKGAGGGIGLTNTMKVAEKIDATNSPVINHYINILQFIEQNMKLAAGMNDQRLAQTAPRTTATDNHRDTMHSINMTESLHTAHDLLWEEVLQGLMEMTISVVDESTGILRGFLSDEDRVLINLDLINLEDNYRLHIADNSRAFRTLEQVKQLAHAFVQNDKAGLHTVVDLLDTTNLNEFKTMAMEVEEEYKQRVEKQQESQREHEKEMLEKQIQAKEDEQIHDLDKIYLGKLMDHKREKLKAELQAMSFDLEKDYNKDGLADYLQLEQLNQKIANESAKVKIEEFKVAQKEREMEQQRIDKQNELTEKQKDRDLSRENSERDRQAKKAADLFKNKLQR